MIYRSRNGSRVPNPYVDNAQPAPGDTWVTVDGHHERVVVMAVPDHTVGYPLICFSAWLECSPNVVTRGVGPGEAIRKLDELLSR